MLTNSNNCGIINTDSRDAVFLYQFGATNELEYLNRIPTVTQGLPFLLEEYQMDYSYIAGFFDGEGSVMVLTVKYSLGSRVQYRIRPVIKIAQKTRYILDSIRDILGYGTILIGKNGCNTLQINGHDNIKDFISKVGPYVIIKHKQLEKMLELIDLQYRQGSHPYTYEEFKNILIIRDEIFNLNCLTRTKIKQKYYINKILSEQLYTRIYTAPVKLLEYSHRRKIPIKLIKCKCGCGNIMENRRYGKYILYDKFHYNWKSKGFKL